MINLNEKYNPETFADFLREFLPEDYEEKEQDITDLSTCKVIKKAREIGRSPSLDVTVLEMQHEKDTDPRVAIATDAFKLLALYGIDKALVIFNNNDSDNYRFSYLTIKLNLDEKNKITKTYSNARRYSFFLGKGAKVKTPVQQLIARGPVKDVEDLLSRFSLEVVNKQFYLEIAKHFDELVKTEEHFLELPFQPDPNVRKNFAMRLVGRIMFCWFLKQKKSKLGQLIPDALLSADAVSDNYYHMTLEPLFFQVLNTQIDSRDIRNELYDQVPYLNGGLFSPQSDDYYEFDRTTFVSKHLNTLKVSDQWFKDFFQLLETYNFTIDENTVFDQELSVDPEMLGRIFENLLAEINPETGNSERKRTGSFYTPRQIVEYMVDQSLLEYLKKKTKIDEEKLQALISYDLDDDLRHQRTEEENVKIIDAIESLKVLDPACGSGAFPIGVLQKTVWILQNVDPDCKMWLEKKLADVPELYRQKIIGEVQSNPFDYTRKLDVIKNSIFGVDIQPIAVEISRLRCFLTLVVESEINDSKQNRGIEPLPNLDFKFVCANTLIKLPENEEKGLFEDHTGIEELSSIMSEYFSCSNQRKAEIRLRFTNTQKEILNQTLRKFGGATGELTVNLTLWDPFSNKTSAWFDSEWMFGVEGKFDIVIANPPYIDSETMVKEDPEYRERVKNLYSTTKGNWDLYIPFIELGFTLINHNGVCTYITPNKWYAIGYGKELRKRINGHLYKIGNCNDVKVFEAGNSPVVTIITSTEKEFVSVDRFDDQYNIAESVSIPATFLNENLGMSLSSHISLITKIRNQAAKISDYYKAMNPCTVSEAYEIKPLIFEHKEGETKSFLKFVNTGTIDPFISLWGRKDTTYLKDKYNRPVISSLEFKNKYPKRFEQFNQPKLVISGMRHFESFLDQDGDYVAGKSTEILVRKSNYSLLVALGILNSKVIKFYISEAYNVLGIDGGINFTPELIDNLPVPDLKTNDVSEKIESIVKKILKGIDENNNDIKSLVDELNGILFELYDLTDQERGLINKLAR